MDDEGDVQQLQFEYLRVHSDVIRPCLQLERASQFDQSAVQLMFDAWLLPPPSLIVHVVSAQRPPATGTLARESVADLEQGFYKLLSGANVLIVSNGQTDNVLASAAGKAAQALNQEYEYVMKHPEFIKEHQDDIGLPKDISFTLISVTNPSAVAESDRVSVASRGTLFHLSQDEFDARQMHFVCLNSDSAEELADFRALFTVQTALGAATKRLPESPLSHGDGDSEDDDGHAGGGDSARQSKNMLHCRPLVIAVCSHLVQLEQLAEVHKLIAAGMPALVLYDTSQLGWALKTACDVFNEGEQSASQFELMCDDLLRLLHTVRHHDGGNRSKNWEERALLLLVRIAQTAPLGMVSLRSVAEFSLANADEEIVNVTAGKAKSSAGYAKNLLLAVGLDRPMITRKFDVSKFAGSKWCDALMDEAVKQRGREAFVGYLLDSGYNANTLLTMDRCTKMLQSSDCQDFFNTIILGHYLGYTETPSDYGVLLRKEIPSLVSLLTGIKNVFPCSAIKKKKSECASDSKEETFVALTMLAILMKRPDLAKLIWSKSCNPIPLAIIAAAMCSALGQDSREWFYYQKELFEMQRDFEQLSVDLLLLAHSKSSTKHCSYDVLCRKFSEFGGFTATHLAYLAENRTFLAQEICQRWVTHMLYGDVQVVLDRLSPFSVPTGIKVLLSVVLVVPIRFWFCLRPSVAKVLVFDKSNRQLEDLVFEGERQALMSHQPSICDPAVAKALGSDNAWHSSETPCSVTHLRKETTDVAERTMVEGAGSLGERFSREPRPAPRRVISVKPQHSVGGSSALAVTLSELDKTSADLTMTDANDGGALCRDKEKKFSLDWLAIPAFGFQKSKVVLPVSFFMEGISRKSAMAQAVPLWRLVIAFYRTPAAKYWLSLVTRLIFLFLFGIAVSMPGCGDLTLDVVSWLWAAIVWSEAAFVLRARMRTVRLSRLRNEALDVCITGVFLLLMLVFKVVSNQHGMHLAEPFVGRCVAAFFLLYMCYATLFIYIPMSATLGPLMVRVKLMVFRDFVNYLLLVCIVMASSAIVVHSVAFPDFSWSPLLWHKAFSWAWFSLFTTDLSVIKESDTCAQKHVHRGSDMMPLTPAEEHHDYCGKTSGYDSEDCARESWVAYAALVQYLVILKLISWPLLFALFAKTAKEVDDEADNIWKYQFYSLVTSFAERPLLPAPLTPLLVVYRLCKRVCRALACCARRCYALCCRCCAKPVPDNEADGIDRTKRPANYDDFWRRLARDAWRQHVEAKATEKEKESGGLSSEAQTDAVPMPVVKGDRGFAVKCGYKIGAAAVLDVPANCVDWKRSVPNYKPVEYSVPAQCFTGRLPAASLDAGDTWHCVRALWPLCNVLPAAQCATIVPGRQALLSLVDDARCSFAVAADGLPRNPAGRRGIAGRGALPRFGPNRFTMLVLVDGRNGRVLLADDPFVRADDSAPPTGGSATHGLPLAGLSKSGLSESDLWSMTAARAARLLLATHKQSSRVVGAAHQALVAVSRSAKPQAAANNTCRMVLSPLTPLPTELSTDNAWLECAAWAVTVGGERTAAAMDAELSAGYSWCNVAEAAARVADFEASAVRAAVA